MAEHRKGEGRFGDEQIARDKLEGRIGRVGAPLVVAGDHGAAAAPLDHHLRAAEHVAGRREPHRHVADLQGLAVAERLGAELRRAAEPRLHQGKRLSRGKHVIVAGARVI